MNAAAAKRPSSAGRTPAGSAVRPRTRVRTRPAPTGWVRRGRVVVDMPPASARRLRALREPPGRKLGPWGLARGGGLRRLGAERDGALERARAAPHGHLDLVAGRVVGDRGDEVAGAVDLGAAELRDDVAGLEAGLPGGPARVHLAERRAAGRRVRGGDAEVGVADLLAGRERGELRLHEVDRDREADAGALVRIAVGRDLVDDADHLARGIEERPAGVAGVERRVGLDRVRDREAV